jgi:glutamyl-tRNA synthetase
VFNNAELDDLIILRSDGNPTYNFCVAVDDWDMQITHVIRGDDHINNTPRQINLLTAMGGVAPHYAHLPMILGPDGQKLSKRHGAVSVLEYREAGFLPSALLNYLARLGWSHGDQEIFTVDEMIEVFDLTAVNKSAAALSPDKMLWTNQQHLMKMSATDLGILLTQRLESLGVNGPFAQLPLVVESLRERAKTMNEMADGARFYFERPTHFDEAAVAKHLTADALALLTEWLSVFKSTPLGDAKAVHAQLKSFADSKGIGLGKLAQPLRITLSGGTISPPIDQVVVILGTKEVEWRVQHAVATFSQ